MNDKEWKIKKKKVKTILDKWSRNMGLGWYRVTISWKSGDAPSSRTNEEDKAVANISTQWMYRSAHLTIYLEEFPDQEEEIERIIVHELCHIYVNPLRSQTSDHYDFDLEEYCVESLASAFLWVRDASLKEVKK